jgi:predicted deacylase
MVIQDGDKEIICRAAVFDLHTVESPDGATVDVRFVKHKKQFKLGEKIEFAPHELAEICFFYKQQADVTRLGIFNYLKAKGLVHDDAEQEVQPSSAKKYVSSDPSTGSA